MDQTPDNHRKLAELLYAAIELAICVQHLAETESLANAVALALFLERHLRV